MVARFPLDGGCDTRKTGKGGGGLVWPHSGSQDGGHTIQPPLKCHPSKANEAALLEVVSDRATFIVRLFVCFD